VRPRVGALPSTLDGRAPHPLAEDDASFCGKRNNRILIRVGIAKAATWRSFVDVCGWNAKQGGLGGTRVGVDSFLYLSRGVAVAQVLNFSNGPCVLRLRSGRGGSCND
jgi:hypothetical protein